MGPTNDLESRDRCRDAASGPKKEVDLMANMDDREYPHRAPEEPAEEPKPDQTAAAANDEALEEEEEPGVDSQSEPGSDRPPRSDHRGFAAMDEAKQRQIASKGGKAAHEKGTAHEFTRDEAQRAGKKGGEVVSQNRAHMAAIGRKGGERVSQDREHMAAIGRKGGEAVSGDREHMAQIGRRGGEARGSER
jgi:general stress protein YciG